VTLTLIATVNTASCTVLHSQHSFKYSEITEVNAMIQSKC